MRMIACFPFLLAAFLIAPYSHGFVPSIPHSSTAASQPAGRLSAQQLRPSWLFSMATEPTGSSNRSSSSSEETSSSLLDVNRQLDLLAEKCSDPTQHAVLLASQCEDLFHSSHQVDIISFNTVLKAWAKTCATLADEYHKSIFSQSTPDIHSSSREIPSVPVYTARDAAEHATQLLLDMEARHSTIIPDTSSHNCVMDAWAKSRVDNAPQACERLLRKMLDSTNATPDTISYNSLLDAWQNAPDGLDRMNKIYGYMESEYANGNLSIKPTIRTVNSIISAHAKRVYALHGAEALECAKEAHLLLSKMKEKYEITRDEDYQVDVMTYTSCMDAYARCGSLEATLCAEELLQEIKDVYASTGNSKLQPNTRTYTALISAWAKTKSYKAPHNAEALLLEMQNSGDEVTKPTARTYTQVIKAWAKSRDNTKPQRALRILKNMKAQEDEKARPNLLTYNAAIDACARCQGTTQQQTEALKIAFAILKSIQREPDMDPNHVTYATVLKATAFLLPAGEERNTVASALFAKARTAGMVHLDMVKNMRKAVDNHVMQELFRDLRDKKGHIDYRNIPPAWSRNVR